MKVRLDSAVCDGFGTCAANAPELFTLDEWGYAILNNGGAVASGQEALAQRAILECPVHAIHLFEE